MALSHSPQDGTSQASSQQEVVIQEFPLVIGEIIGKTRFQAKRLAEEGNDWRFTLEISRDAKSFKVDGIGKFSGRYTAERFEKFQKENPLLAQCIMETYELVCETMMH